MKVIVVYVGEIEHCPPAMSVVQVLCDLGHDVVLCTTGADKESINKRFGNKIQLKVELLSNAYKSDISLTYKFARMYEIRKRIWKVIDAEYNEDSVIWVISEGSVKHIGERIINYRYILHLLELHEGIYYISHSSILKMNYELIAQKARVVLEAEYNRAHITKAWWGLKELPIVFPNKPYNKININKNSDISDARAKEIIMKNADRNIILYQGNISKERPLREYVKAIGELGEKYCFVMMINGENPYPDLNYDNFFCLPFIAPPYHLEVTSRAKIGILSYTPIKNDYSILNTLYCAPNKIWEYSQFGIPMIGNDLPALREMFIEYHNGICLDKLDKNTIKDTIINIMYNYTAFEDASNAFFDSVNLKAITSEIIEKCR